MGYSSPSVIALDYDFTFLYKKGGDMIAFVSESTRLVVLIILIHRNIICSLGISNLKRTVEIF